MAGTFQFAHRVEFEAGRAEEILLGVPALPGVFCLRGERDSDEPYLTRAADLRRRMRRLLDPPESQSKRLNLRERVRWIEYCVTGSEFESLLVVYDAAVALFGVAEGRRRLRLHTPYFLRLTMEHAHPRVYATNRLSRRGLDKTYGPFPSRAGAERYCDAVLYLFKLRRCYEDLEVHPEHPGCAYGEMKKCMAPCNTTCSAEEYGVEARAVEAFFATHGESMLAGIAAERERASAEMEFEAAAAAHERYGKVKAAAGLADEIVGPVLGVRAVVVQRAAVSDQELEAALFLLEGGCLRGPERLSTLGVRAVKEQTSVGSSLFAQPLMLSAVPLEEGPVAVVDSPEVRAERVLGKLEGGPTRPDGAGMNGARGVGGGPDPTLHKGVKDGAPGGSPLVEGSGGSAHVSEARHGAPGVVAPVEDRGGPDPTLRKGAKDGAPHGVAAPVDLMRMGDHLSLFRRWYYRPEKQRAGEVFLPNADGSWPVRRILRGAARMALGEPKAMAETDREGVAAAKTKIIHEGREGVERVVPVVVRKRGAKKGERVEGGSAQALGVEPATE